MTIPVRLIGTFTLTTNSEGFSKCIQLGTTQKECDPEGTLYQFFQRYRVKRISYEFHRRSNTAFGVTNGTIATIPIRMDTASLQTNGTFTNPTPGPPALPGSINLQTDGQAGVLEGAPGEGNAITSTTSMFTDGLPTMYWCKPMASGIVPDSTRTMLEKWPKVSHFEFGTRRSFKMSCPPTIYERKEVAYNLIGGTKSDFGFQHSYIKARRAPWFRMAADSAPSSGPTDAPTDEIHHGLVYIGVRGQPGVTYGVQVTKMVEIEYVGHTVTQPLDDSRAADSAEISGSPHGHGPGPSTPLPPPPIAV